jgi:hypothetical protein
MKEFHFIASRSRYQGLGSLRYFRCATAAAGWRPALQGAPLAIAVTVIAGLVIFA